MMFQNDYRIDRYVAQRHDEIRRAAHERHMPTALRMRTGLALISLGERLRGCTQAVAAPVETRPATPGRRALA